MTPAPPRPSAPARRASPPLGALIVVLLGVALVAPACTATRLEVDGARAHARVVHQVEAGPRIPGTAAHQAVGDWIEAELRRLGGRVESQRSIDSTLGAPMALRNIVAAYGPEGGRPIALCAHWDSRAWADQDPDTTRHDEPVPGANDGASGVAVLLEVAELMAERAPRVPVLLVFFDGEDQGRVTDEYCLGARAFAREYAGANAPRRPRAAFVFDMVGGRDMQIYTEVTSRARASNIVDIVHDAARATGAKRVHDEERFQVYDDHVPLLDAGIPAVDLIDFQYPQWHTVSDLPDRLSPESLEEIARIAGWIVYQSPAARPLTP